MNYLKIANNGEIDVNALKLLGASTKRGDASQIGFFGTGNKYALGYFLRNDIDVRIFSGTDEIEITTETESLGGNDYEVIVINGERTSITTDIGPSWEAWQAVRELYSNAIDCGGESIGLNDDLQGVAGTTAIYIGADHDEIQSVIDNLGRYFAIDRECVFERNGVKIYAEGTGTIYRKGIRVNEDERQSSAFDYDIESLDINEMRVIRYSWIAPERIAKAVLTSDDDTMIRAFFASLSDAFESELFENSVMSWPRAVSESSKDFLSNTLISTDSFKTAITEAESATARIVPQSMFTSLVDTLGAENLVLPKKVSVTKSGFYTPLDATEPEQLAIGAALMVLNSADIHIGYPIHVAEFPNGSCMGSIDSDQQHILIARDVFEMGQTMLISTILEEYFHLRDDVQDETRAMQDSILNCLASLIVRDYGSAKNERAA